MAFFTTKDPEQMDTCFLWRDELMDVPNNWSACRLWRGRTCFGLLLCKITVQFSLMLYMCSQGEWGVGVFACVCVCVCVSLCLFTGQHKDTEQEWSLCVCVYVRVAVTERASDGVRGSIWMHVKGRKNTKYLFVSTYRDFKE